MGWLREGVVYAALCGVLLLMLGIVLLVVLGTAPLQRESRATEVFVPMQYVHAEPPRVRMCKPNGKGVEDENGVSLDSVPSYQREGFVVGACGTPDENILFCPPQTRADCVNGKNVCMPFVEHMAFVPCPHTVLSSL